MRSPAAPHRASSVSAGPEVFPPSRRSGAGVRWSGGRRRAAPQPNLRRWRTRRTWVLIPGKPVRPAVCRMPPSRLASRSQRWLLVLMAGHTVLARSCPHLGTTVEDRTTSQPEIRQNPRPEAPSEELHPFLGRPSRNGRPRAGTQQQRPWDDGRGRRPGRDIMHPMFAKLFIESDPDDLAPEEDRRRRARQSRRARPVMAVRAAAGGRGACRGRAR